MGTRADFYLGRGNEAQWLGSIACDGYPSGHPNQLLDVTTEAEFIETFKSSITTCKDFTSPEEGWPWPWNDSNTTDYSYAWDDGELWITCFGRGWKSAKELKAQGGDIDFDAPKVVFPNMTTVQNVSLKKSGLIIL